MKKETIQKAWAVTQDGRIQAWGEGDELQFDIFKKRTDAVKACREWNEAGAGYRVVRAEIKVIDAA